MKLPDNEGIDTIKEYIFPIIFGIIGIIIGINFIGYTFHGIFFPWAIGSIIGLYVKYALELESKFRIKMFMIIVGIPIITYVFTRNLNVFYISLLLCLFISFVYISFLGSTISENKIQTELAFMAIGYFLGNTLNETNFMAGIVGGVVGITVGNFIFEYFMIKRGDQKIKMSKNKAKSMNPFDLLNAIFRYNFNYRNYDNLTKWEKDIHNFFVISGITGGEGLDEFFFETQDEYIKEGLESLKRLEEKELYLAYKEACNLYKKNQKKFLSGKQLSKQDSERFLKISKVFWKKNKEVESKIYNYVINHLEEFIRAENSQKNISKMNKDYWSVKKSTIQLMIFFVVLLTVIITYIRSGDGVYYFYLYGEFYYVIYALVGVTIILFLLLVTLRSIETKLIFIITYLLFVPYLLGILPMPPFGNLFCSGDVCGFVSLNKWIDQSLILFKMTVKSNPQVLINYLTMAKDEFRFFLELIKVYLYYLLISFIIVMFGIKRFIKFQEKA